MWMSSTKILPFQVGPIYVGLFELFLLRYHADRQGNEVGYNFFKKHPICFYYMFPIAPAQYVFENKSIDGKKRDVIIPLCAFSSPHGRHCQTGEKPQKKSKLK